MIIFVPSPSPSWPPSNADNIFRFEVEVDDAKRVEVSHTLAHLKMIIVVIVVIVVMIDDVDD